MMNGEGVLAQQFLKKLQSRSAMEMSFNEQSRFLLYSCGLKLANAPQMLVDDGTNNRARASLRFSAKLSNEENECLREK